MLCFFTCSPSESMTYPKLLLKLKTNLGIAQKGFKMAALERGLVSGTLKSDRNKNRNVLLL